MGPESRTHERAAPALWSAATETPSPTVAAPRYPAELQRFLQRVGAAHDPEICQPERGISGLCRRCCLWLQGDLLGLQRTWLVPIAEVELLLILRGLEQLAAPRVRPASGPEVSGVQAERDGAHVLIARLARRLPALVLRAELDAAARDLGTPELLRAGLQVAILAAERAAAEAGHGR